MNARDYVAAREAIGEFLMNVRDNSIEHWRMVLAGTMHDSHSQDVQSLFNSLDDNSRSAIRQLTVGVATTVIHQLLVGIERSDYIDLTYQGTETVGIKSISDGPAGELYGERGWIARFSNVQSS